MQNFVILQRSSLVYLAEAVVGTGPHASLGVRSLIWRSPQEHLNCCAQTGAWRGVSARARAWCHRCGAEFGIV